MLRTEPATVALSRQHFDAVIFDLDGVLTDTASVHANAWQRSFDEWLTEHTPEQACFDIEEDYRRHVDGKPREEGIRAFFHARGIPITTHAVRRIARRKQAYFLELLEHRGVDLIGTSVRVLRLLRALGYKTAVATSSRNGRLILEKTGLIDDFDVHVDGETIAKHGLPGKPAPDTFLLASDELGTAPGKTAIVEDALAGIAAGKAGGFGMIVGLSRTDRLASFERAGADIAVPDLAELDITEVYHRESAERLPDALRSLKVATTPILLLDYDGTLTPIVARPEDAALAPTMRAELERLARYCPVAIVSGRDVPVVQDFVGLDTLAYAGSHGFEVVTADGRRYEQAIAERHLPLLNQLHARLQEALGSTPGVQFERKRFSIAVHYRRVAAADRPRVQTILKALKNGFCELRTTPGKEVLEFLPGIDWNKGRAVEWLLQALDPAARHYPIYIGDDLTDEDAFRILQGIGHSILVRDRSDRGTYADSTLPDTTAVRAFLARLADRLENEARL
ncbi:trehalose-phosphatase [Alkalilimnicola ehrlichii]|nr:trehalose-phosphatase [Alkalilimnicola ehrlichii]